MPNSWDIDSALISALQADAELRTLCPDGVYYDVAQPGRKRFVTVSLIDPRDECTFGGRAMEDNLYQVKSVGLSTVFTTQQSEQAAYRIDQILNDGTLTVPGYVFVDMFRDLDQPRIRVTEVDPTDPTLRWFNGGGFYRVRVSIAGR